MKTRIIAAALLVMTAALAVRSAENAPSTKKAAAREYEVGYRGIAFGVSGAQLASLKKGDHVDVLSIFDAALEDKAKEKVAATILQNCRVIELHKADKAGEAGVVELLVNQNEAQYLALALVQGSVHLIRRFEGDREMKPMEMASFRKLFR